MDIVENNNNNVDEGPRMHVKSEFGGDMRRFLLPQTMSLADLRARLAAAHEAAPSNFVIKYLDDEGDHVTLANDEDLATARHICPNLLKIKLVDPTPPQPVQQRLPGMVMTSEQDDATQTDEGVETRPIPFTMKKGAVMTLNIIVPALKRIGMDVLTDDQLASELSKWTLRELIKAELVSRREVVTVCREQMVKVPRIALKENLRCHGKRGRGRAVGRGGGRGGGAGGYDWRQHLRPGHRGGHHHGGHHHGSPHHGPHHHGPHHHGPHHHGPHHHGPHHHGPHHHGPHHEPHHGPPHHHHGPPGQDASQDQPAEAVTSPVLNDELSTSLELTRLGGDAMDEEEEEQTPKAKRSLMTRFVKDVTLPDKSVVAPGARLTKIWRVRNDSTQAWPSVCELVAIGGDCQQLGWKAGSSVTTRGGVEPNHEADLSIDVTAPEKPGSYLAYWRLSEAGGSKFGNRVWVSIVVTASSSSDSGDESGFIRVQPTTSPTTTFHASQAALGKLREMGFEDDEKNTRLLQRYRGNVERVVAKLSGQTS